ncbi:MAG: redox-active disulfide protein 2 [Flavobacterium sp. BFFFF1]|uniref:redox-active disulfide protein 2 n=1 Tax=unclassified Flavobacterium TaxID=196869 RepID=UPI000BD28020|nr:MULTISPECIES: redox-active disulfide protein 2 [unclassified Flavobacterium]OYU80830.1 MAG: redox-active disulfide protein 2 [Flavobacterium sp. BFFFF1]
MKKEDFTQLSTDELIKKKKTVSVVTGTLAGMQIALLGLGIWITMHQGFTALVVIPVALLPILIMNFNMIADIKKELAARNLK